MPTLLTRTSRSGWAATAASTPAAVPRSAASPWTSAPVAASFCTASRTRGSPRPLATTTPPPPLLAAAVAAAPRPPARQRLGDREADPGRRAGHERALAAQLQVHGPL